MNDVEYRKWLEKKHVSKKLQSDSLSRLKKIERDLGFIDIDVEYQKDKCQGLLTFFSENGKKLYNSESMKFKGSSNQYTIMRYVIKQYIHYIEDSKLNSDSN